MKKKKAHHDGSDHRKDFSRAGPGAKGHDDLCAVTESGIEAIDREAHNRQDHSVCRSVYLVVEMQRFETYL